jgi:hypothetical protein
VGGAARPALIRIFQVAKNRRPAADRGGDWSKGDVEVADNHIIPADGIGRPDQQQVPDPSAPRDAAEAARLAAEAAGRECLDAALDYLARGWSSLAICPPDHYGVGRAHAKNCSSPGKAPWGEWKAFQARLPTEAELRRKWADNPQLNVGLALGGMTGLVGLDIDGQPGEALLVELAQGDLPPTLEFTSGKGRRLLYRVPPGVSLRPTPQPGGLKVEGGELRLLGTGSQTVMPPSRHRDSGRRYRWVPGRGPGEIDPAPAPAWVVGLMRADGPRRARGPRPGPAPASNGEAHVAGDAIPEGQRDVRLTSLAGTLRRRGLGHDAILAALAALNETCCTPPLDEAQVAKIASSVSG